MTPFRMAPQILRLVLLASSIVATYAIARAWLVPKSFGQYGHYRGAALEEVASRTPVFAGAKACDECHGEVTAKLARYDHRNIGCESCHGPLAVHAADPDVDVAKLSNESCLRCHTASAARPAWLKQVKPTDHFSGDRCGECHLPHQPKDSP